MPPRAATSSADPWADLATSATEDPWSDLVDPPSSLPEPKPSHPLAAVGDAVLGVLKGAGKGVANTALGIGDVASYLPGIQSGPQIRDTVAQTRRNYATPEGAAEKTGFYGEQIGEFLLPAAKVRAAGEAAAKVAGKVAPFLLPTATKAAVGGGVAGLQTALQGGDVTTGAVLGGAMPIAGKAVTGVAKTIGRAAEPLVRAAVKPLVSELKQVAGASRTGVEAQAKKLVQFILDHRLTSPEKAEKLITDAETELQRVLSQAAPRATDAPQRAERYLKALERSATKQGLPADDVATIRTAMQELLDQSPLSEDVTTTVMKPSPSGLVDASGKPVLVPTAEKSRALRTDVTPQEALDTARSSSRWQTRKSWGEQKGTSKETAKAVERAARDSVKDAVPEAKPILQRQGQAIQAKKTLDRKAFREGNRDIVSLPTMVAAAPAVADGKFPILGAAWQWLKDNRMRAGIWARELEDAITREDVQRVGDIMGRLGVGVGTQPTKGDNLRALGLVPR